MFKQRSIKSKGSNSPTITKTYQDPLKVGTLQFIMSIPKQQHYNNNSNKNKNKREQ